MKINWNYIKGFLLIALTVFLVGFAHHKNTGQKVKDVTILFEEGANLFMDYEMVNKLLIQNGKTVINEAKSVIDLHKLEANVLSHPMVEDASVFLTVDGLLKTKIKQRTPIARVLSKGKSYYIDKQAKVMPLSPNYSARVLIVSGNVNEKNIEKIHRLVTTISNDEFLSKQIIDIEVLPKDEFVLNTRVGEQQIILGNIDNLNEKFKNLKSFYNKSFNDKTIQNYTSLNLKFENQVVCTKK
jgi:cell division protein FtsQ